MNSTRIRRCRRFAGVGIVVLGLALVLSCNKSRAPGVPTAPNGPSSGVNDSVYTFTTSIATDPEGDGVCYRFDWGDGDTSAWTTWVPSGQPGVASHQWWRSGVFEVMAQAKDVGDAVSSWSPGHQLTVAEAWRRTFGGMEADDGLLVQPTSDGGYVIAGWTYSYGAGSGDVWLVRTDASGNKLWDKTFGGANNDDGYSVQQTSDGGYIITGNTYSYGAGDADVWLVKTDASGNKTWDRTFGGAGDDQGNSVQQTLDGGYILAGLTTSYGAGGMDVGLIKTDSAGNEVWDKTFGGTGTDRGNSVRQTTDGGYVVAGNTNSYGAGSGDVWLVKTDASGNKVWDRTFGGTNSDDGNSVQQTSDGGYIIVGNTDSYGAGLADFWLVKTGPSGE